MKVPDAPEVGVDEILKKAFRYWSKTLIYQLVFSVLYLSIFVSVLMHFATEYGLLEQYISALSKSQDGVEVYEKEILKITENPNFINFYYIMLATTVFLFPLNIGFFKIYRKMDLGEKPILNDLFAGYMGVNFFRFVSFYLFWLIIFSYTAPTILLGIMWILITLFTAPLMFFMDKRIFESFTLNFYAVKRYTLLIFVGMLVAFVFKIVGMMTIILLPFTFSFTNAMIYTLYSHVFHKNKDAKII